MIATFVLGFLFGLRHALDADHIAAVASLATRSRSTAETVRTGIAWGIGHTATLFLVSSIVLVMDFGFPERIAQVAEMLVGVILIVLGADVVRRALRSRVHVHTHRHGAMDYHLHFHSHAGDEPHEASTHDHAHASGLTRRAALVGLMHGLAGSAALLLLTVSAAGSIELGLAYVLVFGVGSIIGMAILSFAMAFPLRAGTRFAAWGLNTLNLAVGAGTTILGSVILYQTTPAVARWLLA